MTLGRLIRFAIGGIITDKCLSDADRADKLDEIMAFVLARPDLVELDLLDKNDGGWKL